MLIKLPSGIYYITLIAFGGDLCRGRRSSCPSVKGVWDLWDLKCLGAYGRPSFSFNRLCRRLNKNKQNDADRPGAIASRMTRPLVLGCLVLDLTAWPAWEDLYVVLKVCSPCEEAPCLCLALSLGPRKNYSPVPCFLCWQDTANVYKTLKA